MKSLHKQLQILESKLKRDENDLRSTYESLLVIGEFFKSAFGPFSLHKLLYDKEKNHFEITSDGLVLVKELLDRTENPLVKRLLKDAREFGRIHGDGVKRYILLVCELLRLSMNLLEQGISRNRIVSALDIFRRLNVDLLQKNSVDKRNLNFVQERLLAPVLLTRFREEEARKIFEIVEAASQTMTSIHDETYMDIDELFQFVLMPGHALNESRIANGITLDKQEKYTDGYPDHDLIHPNIVISSEMLYHEKREENDGRIPFEISYDGSSDAFSSIDSEGNKYTKFTDPMVTAFKNRANKIIDTLKALNINLLVTEKGIDQRLQTRLLQNGIFYIRRIKMEQLRKLARFLGIEISQNLAELTETPHSGHKTNELREKYIGRCDRVTYKKIGREKRFLFSVEPRKPNPSGDKPKNPEIHREDQTTTILVGGPTWEICKNVKDSIIKCLKTVKVAENGSKLTPDNYLFFKSISKEIRHYSEGIPSKMQICLLEYVTIYEMISHNCLMSSGWNSEGSNSRESHDLEMFEIFSKERMNSEDILKMVEIYGDKNPFSQRLKPIEDRMDLIFLYPTDSYNSIFNAACAFLMMLLRVDQVIPYQKRATENY